MFSAMKVLPINSLNIFDASRVIAAFMLIVISTAEWI